MIYFFVYGLLVSLTVADCDFAFHLLPQLVWLVQHRNHRFSEVRNSFRSSPSFVTLNSWYLQILAPFRLLKDLWWKISYRIIEDCRIYFYDTCRGESVTRSWYANVRDAVSPGKHHEVTSHTSLRNSAFPGLPLCSFISFHEVWPLSFLHRIFFSLFHSLLLFLPLDHFHHVSF